LSSSSCPRTKTFSTGCIALSLPRTSINIIDRVLNVNNMYDNAIPPPQRILIRSREPLLLARTWQNQVD
jgi:hypothetical protein